MVAAVRISSAALRLRGSLALLSSASRVSGRARFAPAARPAVFAAGAIAAVFALDAPLRTARAASRPKAVNALLEQAASLYDAGKKEKELVALFDAFEAPAGLDAATRAEILWQYARAVHDLAKNVLTDKKEKEATFVRAHELACAAYEADKGNFAVHKWMGISLSSLGDYIATKEKIKNAYKIKEYWEDAAKLAPGDATTVYLLGMWAWNIYNISYFERKAAAVLFGSPPSSSAEEALDFFERAEKAEPGFYIANRVMIARCHLAIGNKAEAVAWLKKALELKVVNSNDERSHAEAVELLKKNE